jgi:hypothetical protein
MTKYFLALAISASQIVTCAASETNGFLVIEIDRYPYSKPDGKPTEPEIKQSFKIPLTTEFLSNFKNPPNDHSTGSGFCCGGQFNNHQDTGFMWWLNKTSNNRWHAHMWMTASNPSVTQGLTFKSLEDLDMFYEQESVNNSGGVNVSFSAKYVSGEEIQHGGSIPTIPVKKADQSELFRGDSLTNCPIAASGSFQEN